MRRVNTLPFLPILVALLCGCSGKKEPEEGPPAGKSEKPPDVPVAGTGTLSSPSDPTESLYTRTYAILPDGDITFTGSTAGVAVFSMGDGTRPERKAGLVLPGSVSGLETLGPESHVLAASSGPTGVALVDTRDARQGKLSLLSSGDWTKEASCHAAWKTRHAGEGRIYIACGTSGVMEAMVDDPAHPVSRRLVATGGYVRDLGILESKPDGSATVVAASGLAGITILAFPVTGEPEVVARLDTAGDARAISLQGTLAFVADGPAGLLVVDLSDARSPTPLAKLDPGESDMLRGLLVHEQRAYLCMGNSGLIIVDVSTPSSPVRLGTFETDRAFNHAALADPYLLGANDDAGLLLLDVSDPAAPRQVFPALDAR